MAQDNNVKAFLALLRAGLWEQVNDNVNDNENFVDGLSVNWADVIRLAEEQSVVGIVAAGVERLSDYSFFAESDVTSRCSVPFLGIPLTEKLTLLGKCQLIEQRNAVMNQFVADLLEQLRENGINVLLVKGQGVAQCYEKPQWRASGDVDLLLDEENYEKTIDYLTLLSSTSKRERRYSKEICFYLGDILVELHGTLRTGLSSRIDKTVDEVQNDTFRNNKTRVWRNRDTDVYLPALDEDVFYVFAHFIKHFYKEGMNLRQLCDWCRLLWTYKDEIDALLLEQRLRSAGLIKEWKSFAALAVNSLGMPTEAMPLYDSDECWCRRGKKLLDFILKSGKPEKLRDTLTIAKIFPWNTFCFLPGILVEVNGLKIKERIFGK